MYSNVNACPLLFPFRFLSVPLLFPFCSLPFPFHPGTVQDFFAARPDLASLNSGGDNNNGTDNNGNNNGKSDGGIRQRREPAMTVVVGFNPGFGSGNVDMLLSWTTDLIFLCRTGLVCIFTQVRTHRTVWDPGTTIVTLH